MESRARGSCLPFLTLMRVLFCISVGAAGGQRGPWQTLDGNAPRVIAKGGHSGLFPDSSGVAYTQALNSSLPGTTLWCDLQLTKDAVGICLPDVRMNNCTNVGFVFTGKNQSTYLLDGVPTTGFFPPDFYFANLSLFALMQGIYSRSPAYDGVFPITSVKNVIELPGRPSIWLNIQHDTFYSQRNLSMRNYLLSLANESEIDYVSSPEVSFLRSIATSWLGRMTKTQLIFRFLAADATEPTTKRKYGALLKDLAFVKTFASGILVPRSYIWPVDASSSYLLPRYTSVVLDAHRAGLRVFAADFGNDALPAYDYNYDPTSEYLGFIDNGAFAVDGLLTDSPITASAAIGCFSHLGTGAIETAAARFATVSHHGASGIYPGCTDLAYKRAVEDGADFIDCPVQVTRDGVLVCMNGIDLLSGTTVLESPFVSRATIIPEIQSRPGVYTFNLTWAEIRQNLKPQMETPMLRYGLRRNPLKEHAGAFMSLADFLAFADDKAVSGISISIQNAVFLARKLGFRVVDGVLKALSDSGYERPRWPTASRRRVIIQSSDSSVLTRVKQRLTRTRARYELMYTVDEVVGDATPSAIRRIRGFADSVAIMKGSVYPSRNAFVLRKTDLVAELQRANMSVYAYRFMNEFTSQAWDYYSDPAAEINEFVQDARVDGIITDHPATAAAYRRNRCLKERTNTPPPPYMRPVSPGYLVQLLATLNPSALPPAMAPLPPLTDPNVVEPPLPAA